MHQGKNEEGNTHSAEHYYLEMPGPWKGANTVENDYLYNGKELNADFGLNMYDYGARMYDVAIGRFTGVDPISDQFPHVSTFNYAENEPIANIDLWGLQKHRMVDGSIVEGPISRDRLDVMNARIIPRMTSENHDIDQGTQADGQAMMELFSPEIVGTILMMAEGTSTPTRSAKTKLNVKAGGNADDAVEISIDANKFPESAAHLDDAISSGKSNTGVIDRAGTESRRRSNLKGTETKPGFDRDEAPPAVINTGQRSSVKHNNKSDNRGAGGSIGHQLKGLKDGTKVRIVTKKDKN